MAGDWIKVEHATARKPEIALGAELLGMDRRQMLGLMFDYWIWLDQNLDESRNGLVTHVSRKSLEDTFQCPGFAAILERMGWASFDDEARTLCVINWDRHNGKSAKSRALVRERQKRFRNADRNGSVTQIPLPEKRREEKRYKVKTIMSSSQANIDDARLLLQFLNDKAKRFFRPTAKTLEPILSRLREGNSVSDCKAVIVRRCRVWLDDPEMVGYLRPDTLFNATKFAQYIGEVPPEESHANQAMP